MDRKFPQISNLVPNKVDRELQSTVLRLYETIDQLEKEIAAKAAVATDLQAAQIKQLSDLVKGYTTKLINLSAPSSPLVGLGSGTVTSVTAGSGLSGGAITGIGTIALLIGSNDVVQKSNGTQLVNSQINDDGVDVLLAAVNLLQLGASQLMTIDSGSNLIFVNLLLLPTSDPGISGALYLKAGGLAVSP